MEIRESQIVLMNLRFAWGMDFNKRQYIIGPRENYITETLSWLFYTLKERERDER